MTLTARIYLLVSLAVAPAFALMVMDHRKSVHQREAEAEQQALRSTWLVSSELEQVFKGIESLLRAAAQTPMVIDFKTPECTDYLARVAQINANAGQIIAVDGQGKVRCGGSAEAVNVADRNYFQAALATDELVVGTYTIGRSSGAPILPLALKIRTSEGPGMIVAGVRLDWLREHFANLFAKLPAHSSLTIVDRNGIILVRLPNFDREGKQLVHYEYVVNAPQPGTFRSTADKNADGIARFLGFTPLASPPRGVAIAVGYPQEAALIEMRASAKRNYMLFALAAILAFVAAAIGGHLFIRRPVTGMLGTIARWRSKDMTARVTYTADRSELGQLGKAFNALADDLEAALKHKDVLLRELGHRVMNSLQTISALFRLQSRSVQDPAAAAQFEQAITRIDAIARAYRRMQAADGVKSIEFGSLLAELCKDVHSSIMKTPCIVKTDPLLLSPKQAIPLSLVANELLTNAIKYGTNSDDPIVVELKRSPDQCRLSVRNSGDWHEGCSSGTKGFGSKMVLAMVNQVQGELKVISGNGTTEVVVTFRPEPPSKTIHEGQRHPHGDGA